MPFINLTPHAIVIVDGPTFAPSGTVARCGVISAHAGSHAGVNLSYTAYGEVIDLPDPSDGVYLIVSGLVRSAVPGRADVVSPGDLARDGAGVVIGCRGLVVNHPQ